MGEEVKEKKEDVKIDVSRPVELPRLNKLEFNVKILRILTAACVVVIATLVLKGL